jgi:hypothetical protein
MEVSKYQKFESTTISRSQINGAEYNPRKISDEAKKKLKENIKRVGLLDTIVVNKNTMNIVSGHQRISILDSLERRKDYNITVALVDLTEKEEKEQNIFFNNAKAQGEYDTDILAGLLEDIDFENAGLDINDLGILGVEVDLLGSDVETEADKELMMLNKRIFDNKREMRKAVINHSQAKNEESVDTFVVLTFSSQRNKESFLQRFGFRPQEKYVKGEALSDMVERID